MPDFKSLEEVADYLKANGYEDVEIDKFDGRKELIVSKMFSEAIVYKEGSKWTIDVQHDQSGDYFYADDLQGVVSIINQEL